MIISVSVNLAQVTMLLNGALGDAAAKKMQRKPQTWMCKCTALQCMSHTAYCVSCCKGHQVHLARAR